MGDHGLDVDENTPKELDADGPSQFGPETHAVRHHTPHVGCLSGVTDPIVLSSTYRVGSMSMARGKEHLSHVSFLWFCYIWARPSSLG